MKPAGIDDLNIYGSTLQLRFDALAEARGLSARDLQASQFAARSVTPPFEDPVTLAVNAAKPLVDAAGADRYELLMVATETGLDFGKPISTYVHRHLGLPSRCRNLEVKHACYGGTASLQLALSWLRAQPDPTRRALVVMTDMARRHFADPAELTAGTGAVALSLAAGDVPRILDVEAASGYACKEVYDVARPTATSEWGDAVLSLSAYLDLVEASWENYRLATGRTEPLGDQFRYMLYHTPLVSLAERAHRALLELDSFDVTDDDVQNSFDRMVRPALSLAGQLANTYSGSVYTLLAGLLEAQDVAPGTRLGLFSYGSGSASELYSGLIGADACAVVASRRIREHLAARRSVSVAEYEALVVEGERCLTSAAYTPPRNTLAGLYDAAYAGQGRLVLTGIENHYRTYAWS
jgi:3-hydroxy-3-methylglutaryl CoA synthase